MDHCSGWVQFVIGRDPLFIPRDVTEKIHEQH